MYEYTFLASWLKGNDVHMSNALVFACDFKFWLNCRTILLFCGTILFGTIWPWNKDSDRIPDTDIHQSIILWRHSSSVCLLVSQYVGQHPFFSAIISIYMWKTPLNVVASWWLLNRCWTVYTWVLHLFCLMIVQYRSSARCFGYLFALVRLTTEHIFFSSGF